MKDTQTEAEKAMRGAIVAVCLWGGQHETSIHYTQDSRRDDWLHLPPRTLPMWCDCSSFATYVLKQGGAADPSGYSYHQVGNSQSILNHGFAHGLVIPLAAARKGDLVVFGAKTATHHVSILTQSPHRIIRESPKVHRLLADACVSSHGSESGPYKMKLQDEINWEPTYWIVKSVPA